LSTTLPAGAVRVGLVCQTVPVAHVPELDSVSPSQVWTMPDGDTCALGYRIGPCYWMEWPGFASFCFNPAEPTVTAFVQAGVSRHDVDDVWRRSVLPLVLVTRGLEALHASASAGRDGVVAFCATSGTGKSTLAFALRARGFGQWSDDAVVFDVATGRAVSAIPLPYSSRLDAAASQYVTIRPPAHGIETGHPAPLAGICVISRLAVDSDRDIEVNRLEGSAALLAVLPHAHVFDQADLDRTRRMVDAFLSLVDRVPVFDVRFRPGPDAWPAVLDRLAEHVGLLVNADAGV
jgi:hypothetical protein